MRAEERKRSLSDWLEGLPKLGGAAELTTLVNETGANEDRVFIFDLRRPSHR